MSLKSLSVEAGFGATQRHVCPRPRPEAGFPEDVSIFEAVTTLPAAATIAHTIIVGGVELGPALTKLLAFTRVTRITQSSQAPHFCLPDGELIDLENWEDCERLLDIAQPGEATLVIVDRLLEYLSDPRPFLATLRQLLHKNIANRAVVAHWERQAGAVPERQQGYRSWSAAEMSSLLTWAGFDTLRTDTTSDCCGAHVVKGTPDQFRAFLTRNALPPPKIKTLVVTSEHPDFNRRGEIGTFIGELERVVIPGSVGFFLCDPAPRRMRKESPSLLHARMLFDPAALRGVPFPDIVLKSVSQLLLYYPRLERIEYQDALGIGLRLAQAKRAGLLPNRIALHAHCHGGKLLFETAERRMLDVVGTETATLEKLSIELADKVLFPSRFLQTLYEHSGIELGENRAQILRLPFARVAAQPNTSFVPVDTLVFCGEQTLSNGFPDLLQALLQLGSLQALGIRHLYFIGPQGSRDPETDRALEKISENVRVKYLDLTGAELPGFIDTQRARSLWILPYRSRSHAYAILEMMLLRASFIAFDDGGIPELVPNDLREELLVLPEILNLATAIRSRVTESIEDREARIERAHASALEAQRAVNSDVKAWYAPATVSKSVQPKAAERHIKKRLSLSVCVAVTEASAAEISELADSIQHQALQPDEILLFDTGNNGSRSDIFQKAFHDANLSIRVTPVAMPSGCLSIRNQALAEVEGDIVVFLEPRSMLLPRFLLDVHSCFARLSDAAAVTCYVQSLNQSAALLTPASQAPVNRPIGHGIALGHVKNCFGSINAAFRRSAARQVGGWDSTSDCGGEDWSFFLKLVTTGQRIAVIPDVRCLLRPGAQPIRDSAKRFSASRNVARALEGARLDRFEALRLESMVQHLHGSEQDVSGRSGEDRTQVASHSLTGGIDNSVSQIFRASARLFQVVTDRSETDETH
ncbi:MAG: hypothetical protein U0136_10755 [Bdellovibrionota bacterium]